MAVDPLDPSAPIIGETSTEVQQVNLNVCTRSQYGGEVPIYDTQFYAITDAPEPVYAADAIGPLNTTPWIDKSMVDWTKMSIPTVGNSTRKTYGTNGTINTNSAIDITEDGFLSGKAVTFSSGKHAMLCTTASDAGVILGGIPYTDINTNNQVGFCFPVRAGQRIYARVSGSNAGQLEGVKLINIVWS